MLWNRVKRVKRPADGKLADIMSRLPGQMVVPSAEPNGPDMTSIEGRSIHVFGHVQGVNFRQSTRDLALSLGITGFARNEDDGTVTIEATGDADAVDKLERWCRHGPRRARVDRIEVTLLDPGKQSGFLIL